MAPAARQLDNRIEVVTPENIAFEHLVAGPFSRLPAYLIDVLIRIVLLVSVSLVLWLGLGVVGFFGIGIGLSLVLWLLLEWFYGGLFETFWNGQTPGKRLMRLRVVSVDGQPINALQAVLRNVLRAVDGMPVFPALGIPTFLVGLVASTISPRAQRLGDLACGTTVILEERQQPYGVVRVREQAAIDLAAQLPASFVASRSLARTLARYVERRRLFAPARQAEIAKHLGAPLVDRFGLPPTTSHDLLLCALYHRTFITDRAVAESIEDSPFAEPAAAAADAMQPQ